MKKIILTMVSVMISCVFANAQTVITNNYDTPIQSVNGNNLSNQSKNNNDDVETISYGGLAYYSYDGFENWGLSFGSLNYNGFGLDFNIRNNFDGSHGNLNVDLCPNYSIGLYNDNNTTVFFTLAAGPSVRTQDKLTGFDDYDQPQYESAKTYLDLMVNARLSLKFNRFMISAGYDVWGAEFKLSKGYKADGFMASLSYTW